MLAREAKKIDASICGIFNNDLFVVFPGDALASMEEALARVSHVLGIDSFFAGGAADAEKFCSHFDLDTPFGALVERIESLIPARGDQAPLPPGAQDAARQGQPLALSNLPLPATPLPQADLPPPTT